MTGTALLRSRMRGNSHVRFCRPTAPVRDAVEFNDQRTLHGGRFLAALRTAYSERVVEEVKRRFHGTVQRQVEGGVIKIRMRF